MPKIFESLFRDSRENLLRQRVIRDGTRISYWAISVTKTPPSKNIMSFYCEPSMDMETHSELVSFQNGVRSIKQEDEEVWRNENLEWLL
jgi:hypothetical protein